MKFYLHLSGGLGDHLLSYFYRCYQPGCCNGIGYLEELKKHHPDSIVKLISHPIQANTIDIFKTHPLISEAVELPWHNPCHKCPHEVEEAEGYKKLADYGKEQGWEYKPCKQIYRTEEDENNTRYIIDAGPYITIHPFAGEDKRVLVPIKEIPSLVDLIIEELDCNVVVLGADHVREYNSERHVERNEKFTYERPRLFNLVNKVNIRSSIHLVHQSKGLIATDSAILCSVSGGNIPLVALHNNVGPFIKILGWAFADNSKATAVTREQTLVRDQSSKIIQHLRKYK